jgi:hypothetical protein
MSQKSGEGDANDDRDSTASEVTSNAMPLFQNQLMQFLDKKAPVLGKVNVCHCRAFVVEMAFCIRACRSFPASHTYKISSTSLN